MPSVSNLSKCSVSSSRLASIFDWKRGSQLLSMQISKHQISLSIAEHPTRNESKHIIHNLDPITYMPKEQKNISKAVFNTRKEMIKAELNEITKDCDIVGFVVGYPLEETGNPGAACGRVLHLLDCLADARNGKVINPSRPFTLWDQRGESQNHFEEQKQPVDKWGRSAAFCHYPIKNGIEVQICDDGLGNDIQMYLSNHSKDHLFKTGNNSECSERIMRQFLNSHYQKNEDKKYIRHSTMVPFEQFIRKYEDSAQCLSVSLL